MNLFVCKRVAVSSRRSPKRPSKAPAMICVAVGLLCAASPAVVEGQAAGPLSSSWSLGVAGGSFKYEPSADNSFPIIAVRLDRPVSQWVRFEVGTTYTRPEIQADSLMFFDPTLPAEYTNLFTVTVGIQARATLGPVEPYGGFSLGFFGRYDADRSFGRSTFQFPFGVRLWATDHIGVRGEYRWDQDAHEGRTRSDSEWTAGVFWTF